MALASQLPDGRISLPSRHLHPTPQARSVEVVATPNSYVLLSTNSMALKQATVNSGFVAVADFGVEPFLN